MDNFVGIDLGTTNSAICSYNGSETRIGKSPEQNDVTPSAIYFGRRGNKYVGQRAYEEVPRSPGQLCHTVQAFHGYKYANSALGSQPHHDPRGMFCGSIERTVWLSP